MPCTPRQVEKLRNHSAQPTTSPVHLGARARTARVPAPNSAACSCVGGELAVLRAPARTRPARAPARRRRRRRAPRRTPDRHPRRVQVDVVEAADVAVVVAEHRPRRRVHREPDALDGGQPDPAGHQHPAEVPVPDQHDVAVGERAPRRRRARTSARSLHLLRGLAAGRGVVPHRPAGHRLADLGGGEALVLAVVPLDEPLVDAVDAQARPARRSPARAARRAGEDERGRCGRASMRRPRLGGACARTRPRSVSGMSVRPVCCPDADHSVWPCRSSTRRPGSDAGSWEATWRTLAIGGRPAARGATTAPDPCGSDAVASRGTGQAAALVSQKILSIWAMRSSSSWPVAGSVDDLAPPGRRRPSWWPC